MGFFLTTGFFAVRFGLTNVSGEIDQKNYFFSVKDKEMKPLENPEEKEKKNIQGATLSSLNQEIEYLEKIRSLRKENYCKIENISQYFPQNSQIIIATAQNPNSDQLVSKMLNALELELNENHPLKKSLENCSQNSGVVLGVNFPEIENDVPPEKKESAFFWVNTPEWQAIKEATLKDKPLIEQTGKISGIEPRLIVSSMIVEQLRLFNSEREVFKKFFEPLKILCSANKISLGVMGIKEKTAIDIENHLKDSTSVFYLGKELENILDFSTNKNISQNRYNRLVSEKDHYYSYLYGGLYLKQIMNQWKKEGFPIEHRPEIIGTLFNVGFPQSKPNPDPKVGGSHIKIGEKEYSFGSLVYEFYYSGELLEEFPFE